MIVYNLVEVIVMVKFALKLRKWIHWNLKDSLNDIQDTSGTALFLKKRKRIAV